MFAFAPGFVIDMPASSGAAPELFLDFMRSAWVHWLLFGLGIAMFLTMAVVGVKRRKTVARSSGLSRRR